MKRNIILWVMVIFTFHSYSQCPDWNALMAAENANYFQITSLVDAYFETHVYEEVEQDEGNPLSIENYNRWKNFWRTRVGDGSTDNVGSFARYGDQVVNSVNSVCTSINESNWSCLGPDMPNQFHGLVSALAFDPDDATKETIYLGTNLSGIWKSTDAKHLSPQWTSLQDQNGLPGWGVSSIVVLPSSGAQKRIFLGTSGRGYGVGVVETANGGTDWNVMAGLNIGRQEVLRLKVDDPVNPSYLFVLTRRNLLKVDLSSGPNYTYTNLFSIGVSTCLPTGIYWNFNDLELDPNDPNTIYVSTSGWDVGTPPCAPDMIGSRIFKLVGSNSPVDITQNHGGLYDLVRICLATCNVPTGNHNVYTVSRRGNTYITQIYNGTTWGTANISSIPPWGSYLNDFQVSLTDPNVLYLDGPVMHQSTNLGQSWGNISVYSTQNSTMIHPDIRCMLLEASSSGGLSDKLYVGNDGGVAYTETSGGSSAGSWQNKNGTGLIITQFYGIDVTEKDKTKITGGAQDNGQISYDNGNWYRGAGGDGYQPLIYDIPGSPYHYYYGEVSSGSGNPWSTLDNAIYYSSNLGSSYLSTNRPIQISSETRPITRIDDMVYIGYQDIFGAVPTLTGALNWSQLTTLSLNPDIHNGMESFALLSNPTNLNHKLGYVSYAQNCWQGCSPLTGSLFRNLSDITDISQWQDISDNIRINGTNIFAGTGLEITDMALDPSDHLTIWATVSSFGPNRVIKSTDGGSTWIDYSQGLDNWPVNCIVYQKGSDDMLYIGNDRGIYYRSATMSQWECYDKNLPISMVVDLKINYCAQLLRASAYGRGVWESPLATSQKVISANANWYNETKDITSDIIVPNGVTLNVSLCTLNVAKGKRITVESGGHLVMLVTQLTNACDEMWDGIYVENGGTLAIGGASSISNAYRGVNLDEGSISSIEDCTFDKNFIGISSHDFSGSSTSTIYPTTYIAGCTFDCSGNLPPYFGGSTAPIALSWAYTGIQLSNVGAMFVGDVAKNVNTFQNLTNGIVSAGSNLEVVNSKFRHIVDYHVYNNTHDGTAILSAGGNGVYSLRVTGLGTPAMTSPTNQTFLDCKAGIKTFRNVGSWIESCWMEDVDYGFEAFRCNYVNSTITNNYFDCNFMGTLFNQCDINNVLSIGDNTYVMTPASRYITTLPSYAIQVLESGFQNYSSAHLIVAQNNILLEFGLGGILISNVNNAWVKWNQVTTFQNNNDPNSSDLVNAISVNGCDQAYVSCNQIQSMDNTSSSEQIGLHSSGSENGRYLCNNITSGFHGMHFGGAGYGNEISGNVFSDYYIGFYIESTGYSGSQFHNGNIWDDINPNSPIGAFNNNSTSLAFTQLSLFDVNGSLVSDVHPTNNLETPIWGLPAWFTDDPSTDDYMCGSSLECAIVDVWEPNPNIDDINAADYVIANGQVGAENYSEQLVWTSKMNLYKKLDRIKNELPPSEPLLNFYDELANSTIAKLEEINNLISNGSEVDPVYGSILQGNVDPLNVSFENLKLKYESYFNETDDSVRLTYMLDIEMLQNQIQSLSSNSNNAILQIENLRTAEVLQAELENGGIETQVAIEENERLMKDILTNYLDESFERFTEEDSLIINEIATKCPYEGGCRAVYLARSFYYMLHGPTFFNDPDKCTPLGYFRKSNKDYFEDNAIQVIPNPFQNSLQIILGQELSENGEFVLFNLIGERVLNVDLSKDQKQFEVLTQNIKSGFYYFKIVSNNSVFGTGKILKVGE